jgi:hypothetical protein
MARTSSFSFKGKDLNVALRSDKSAREVRRAANETLDVLGSAKARECSPTITLCAAPLHAPPSACFTSCAGLNSPHGGGNEHNHQLT